MISQVSHDFSMTLVTDPLWRRWRTWPTTWPLGGHVTSALGKTDLG
jgi:hypothetical protein